MKRNAPKRLQQINDLIMTQYLLDRNESMCLLAVITGRQLSRAAQWLGVSINSVNEANTRLKTMFGVTDNYQLAERVLNDRVISETIRKRKAGISSGRGRPIK